MYTLFEPIYPAIQPGNLLKQGFDSVRALSFKNPYATLMRCGKIETRTWHTKYRGLVLICASQKPYTEADLFGLAGEVGTQRIFTTLNSQGMTELNGHAIAVGWLANCWQMTKKDAPMCYVNYRKGLWCHQYVGVRAIKPIPFKGAQGWRKLTLQQIQQIEII